VLGVMVVLPIGGADMPVVISLLKCAHRALRGRDRADRTRQALAAVSDDYELP